MVRREEGLLGPDFSGQSEVWRHTINRVLTTQRGFVKIVPVPPAVMAARMCRMAVSKPG